MLCNSPVLACLCNVSTPGTQQDVVEAYPPSVVCCLSGFLGLGWGLGLLLLASASLHLRLGLAAAFPVPLLPGLPVLACTISGALRDFINGPITALQHAVWRFFAFGRS